MIIFDEDIYTQGAIRVLSHAANLAEFAGENQIFAEHLLQALVETESHAAEILEKHGFTSEKSAGLKRVSENDGKETDTTKSVPGPGLAFEEIVHQAKMLQNRWNHLDSVGTIHLLWGMVVSETSVAEKLKNAGLDRLRLEKMLIEIANENTDSIPVNFELFPSTQNPREVRDQVFDTDRPAVLRILDAAANRAREAFRVLEDYTRFVLDDAHLTSKLKTHRHDFVEVLASIDADRFLRMRETQTDVGAVISTADEYRRKNIEDVLRANFKRLEESLRSLEEYSKTIDASSGEKFERIRYRIYTLEKAVTMTVEITQRLQDSLLYLLLTKANCKLDSKVVLREAFEGGIDLVQVREKNLDDRELIAWGNHIREIAHQFGKLYIMNDRPDLAVLTQADGVHLGQEEMSVKEARKIVGPEVMIGISTHNIQQARQAVLDGADYIGVGPVFPSKTKSFDEYAGLDFLEEVVAEISLPTFAIGGIDSENVQQVIARGIHRIAFTSAICQSDEPGTATQNLRRLLSEFKKRIPSAN